MNELQKFRSIETIVLDVDGVLTNGLLTVLPNGVMARQMNIKDGYAIQRWTQLGKKIAIISGGNSVEVKERLHALGVSTVYMRVDNKLDILTQFALEQQITLENTLYMGDDMPDMEAMKAVGLPCCPFDSAQAIKHISHYISPYKGGEGCVRDIIEKCLTLQQQWHPQ